MSAWAVDREFVNIDWAQLGPNFTQVGSNLIQIESNCDPIVSYWRLLGQKWSWPVWSQNCENLVLSKVIFHCKNKALGSVRQKHGKKVFQIICVFLMKVDFAMLSRARERGDPDQLRSLRIARKGPRTLRALK